MRSSTTTTLSNAASFVVSVDFAEPVVGFTLSDLTVLGGAASNFTPVNAATGKYSATITPAGDGNVTVLLPANSVTDAAGNGNLAAVPLVRTIDRKPPTPKFSSVVPSRTNQTTFDVIVEFGETVTGLTKSDFVVSGATASDPVPLSDGRYSIKLTGADGSISVNMAAGAVTDLAGNANLAAAPLNVTVDTSALVPVLSSPTNDVLGSPTFPVSVTFGQEAVGFGQGKITVLGGTIQRFVEVDRPSGRYTFDVTAAGDGTVSVIVAGGVVRSLSGSDNAISNLLLRTIDRTSEPVLLSSSTPSMTNQASFEVDVNFGESVTNFSIDDVTVSSGTVSDLVDLTGGKYRLRYTGTEGVTTISIPAGAAADAAGNLTPASSILTRTIDLTGVNPTLSSTVGDLSNALTFVATARFGEPVIGLTFSDFTVLGGVASDLQTVDDSTGTYEITVTPSGDGSVSVLLPSGAAEDASGNASTAADPLTRLFDRTPPTVRLTSDQPSRTNRTNFDVVARFSEKVTDLTPGSIAIVGGTVGTPARLDDGSFIIPISDASGDVSIRLNAAAASDSAGNFSSVSNTTALSIDTTSLVPRLTSSVAGPVNSPSATIDVLFEKPVIGFTLADISLVNAVASNLELIDAATGLYRFDVTSTRDGSVNVFLVAGVVADSAGNANSPSNQVTWTLDRQSPEPKLSSTLPALSNQSSFVIGIDFAETVTGFELSDLVVDNGVATNLQPLGQGRYTATVTTPGGEVTVGLADGVATDAAGNASVASGVLTRTIDTVRPRVTFALSPSLVMGTFGVSIRFSRPVTGLLESDFVVGNGRITNLSGDGQSYSAELIAAGLGEVSVELPAGRVTDSVANTNGSSDRVIASYQPTSIVLSGFDEAIELQTLDPNLLSVIETIDIRGTGNNSLRLSGPRIEALTPGRRLSVIADEGDEVHFDAGWKLSKIEVVDGKLTRMFTNRDATVGLRGPQDWTNPILNTDVDANGAVSAIDALRIINALNDKVIYDDNVGLYDAATVDPKLFAFYDVNHDSNLTALDALLVINELNRIGNSPQGEPSFGLVSNDAVIAANDQWRAGSRASRPLASDRVSGTLGELPQLGSVKVVRNSIDPSQSQKLGSVDVATATDAAFAEEAESIDRVLETVEGW